MKMEKDLKLKKVKLTKIMNLILNLKKKKRLKEIYETLNKYIKFILNNKNIILKYKSKS